MAADLHIHVFEGITENDLKKFFSHSLGSKYFDLGEPYDPSQKAFEDACRIEQTPNVHICEVSWLKAALFGDSKTYVPSVAEAISELIGEDLPVLDEVLYTKIAVVLYNSSNSTTYDVSATAGILEFLRKHMGKKLFLVSW